MVSIFAAEVFSDTQTVTLDDNNSAQSEFNTKISFSPQNIDSTLGGFTYIETAIMSWEFDPALDIINTATDSSDQLRVDAKPSFEFNNTIDLFADVSFDDIIIKNVTSSGGAGNFGTDTITGEQTATFVIDKYGDTPAVMGFEFNASGDSVIEIDGTQTTNVTVGITLIGRQP